LKNKFEQGFGLKGKILGWTKILVRGSKKRYSYFLRHVLWNVIIVMDVMSEESFGPVSWIMKVKTDEEA